MYSSTDIIKSQLNEVSGGNKMTREMKNTNKLSAEEILQSDLESIYIGNLNTVESKLDFPKKGKLGSKFVWETGESRFIDSEGNVYRPLHGMGNRKVNLKVVAYYQGESLEKEFVATVLQEKKETIVNSIELVKIFANPGENPMLPPVVVVHCVDGRCMTMPVIWDKFEVMMSEGSTSIEGKIEGCQQKAHAEIHFCNPMPQKSILKKKIEFPLISNIELLPGTLFYEYQQLMIKYLLSCDDDQLLYNFRKAAGLDTLGALPMTGWDEESCKLKGHTTGHYLSGLALAWGASKNDEILKKIVYVVNELKKCQDAFEKQENYHKGFLSAYSEEQFDLLEKFVKYPEIWAPYYTLDKIMSGLYDCYTIVGIEKAKDILIKMGDWVYERLSRLPKEVLDKMWSMYIAGEYGGMLGTMVKLYRISNSSNHLMAARLFNNEKLFYPMEHCFDTLEDMHANQHIPQIIGAIDMFTTTGEQRYWDIAKNFWDIVTKGHTYCIGGVGETEMFHRAGTTCHYLTEKAAESCASYNLLRLTGEIFSYLPEGKYMDYYDNTLRNHILTSCSHQADGGTTYFMPLGPGECKEYSTTENTCCHGTGMESRFRYMEHIYSYNEEYIYINFFVSSKLSDIEEIQVQADKENIVISCLQDMKRKFKIHIPSWMKTDYKLFINEEEKDNFKQEDGYVMFEKCCKKGDKIVIQGHMKFSTFSNDPDDKLANITYGPYIMAAICPENEMLKLPAISEFEETNEDLHFRNHGILYMPFAMVDEEPHHVYFKKK